MPHYKAAILMADSRRSATMLHFLAGCDEEAIVRMPFVADDSSIEIWRNDRLIALIDAESIAIANGDLRALSRAMIARIARARLTSNPQQRGDPSAQPPKSH